MFWGILSVILIAFGAGGFYFSGLVIHPLRNSREELLHMECDRGSLDKEAFMSLTREEIRLVSRYGYELHGLFFPAEDSDKTVIICHGISCNVYSSIKYMDMFRKRGFNILLYDQRNHGDSGGSSTTFGYYEKYDLETCTDWVFERFGNDCTVGLHGESMGAAVVLQSIAIDPRIAFCVADCPFSDLRELLEYRLKGEYRLPSFPAMHLTRLFVWLRTGMKLMSVSPIREISDVETPVFFVHGKEDRYIPSRMSIDLYDTKIGKNKLYLSPNARHAESVIMNSGEYDRLLGEFLWEIKIK